MSRGFAPFYILISLAVLVAAVSVYYAGTRKNITPPVPVTPKACTEEAKQCSDGSYVGRSGPNCEFSPCPTISPWKTYQNSQYGFELQYPAKGIVLGEKDNLAGGCGQSIKEQKGQILVDNFFEIKVIGGQKTVEDYLAGIGAKNQYNLESFITSGADEAVEVLGLKKGAEYAVGYPPLVYVTYIFRKGSNIFLIKDFLHSENIGGCINPKVLDPVKYPEFANKDWDLKKSFKFL